MADITMSDIVTSDGPFPGYLGQTHAVNLLAAALRGGRLGHAYIFAGPSGTGKEPLALAAAKAVNCRASHPEETLYCNECSVCRRIGSFDYLDVPYLFPVPRNNKFEHDFDPDEMAARLEEKREEPHRPLAFDRNVQILIGQIRQLRETVSRPPLEGKLRVVIVTQAHMMNIYTANAFLKILEEPPEHTIFILTTPQPQRLPPTVVSRCQIIRFGRLTDEEVATILDRHTDLDAAAIRRVIPLCAGSAGRAVEMSREDYHDLETITMGMLELLESDDRSMLESAAEITRAVSREKVLKAFELLCILNYGRALEDAGETPFIRPPEALSGKLESLKFGSVQALEAVRHTEEAKEALQANVSVPLLVLRWVLAVRRLVSNHRKADQ